MYLTSSCVNDKKAIPSRFSFFVLATLVFSFVLTGCEGSSTDPGGGNGYGQENNNGNGNEEPAADEVWLVGQSFTPSDRQVEVGTTVTWINQSDIFHTVTSGSNGVKDDLFDSDLSAGENFSYEFNEAGTYDYYCKPHFNSGMTGTITVTEPEGDSDSNGSNRNDVGDNDSGNNDDNGGY